MRTGFSCGILVCALASAPLQAADAPPAGNGAGGAAPTMQDYQDQARPDVGSGPGAVNAPPAALDLGTPGASPSPAAPSITKPEDANWLQQGVDAERKANEARQNGQAPDSPLKTADPLVPAKPALPVAPNPQAISGIEPPKAKDGAGTAPGGFAPIVPIAGAGVTNNPAGFQPLLKGLSSDAMKPLATAPAGTTTNATSALSSFQTIETNPDVTRPIYLDSSFRGGNAPAAYGTASLPSDAPEAPKLPAGYEIPNDPSARPAGLAPIASAAPLAPVSPAAAPAGSGALSSFAPIQPISVPTAPVAPQPPTARDLAPTAGPGSAMKVKDPVSADLPFIR